MTTQLKTHTKRCNWISCRKKLKLTDITCKCKFTFCAFHRYPEEHQCPFDYRETAKQQLMKDNPDITPIKFEKI